MRPRPTACPNGLRRIADTALAFVRRWASPSSGFLQVSSGVCASVAAASRCAQPIQKAARASSQSPSASQLRAPLINICGKRGEIFWKAQAYTGPRTMDGHVTSGKASQSGRRLAKQQTSDLHLAVLPQDALVHEISQPAACKQ